MRDPFATPRYYEGFEEFMLTNPDRIFRYWVYKRNPMPNEQNYRVTYEALFESAQERFGLLRESVLLPDGDVLLGFAEFVEDASETVDAARVIAYYRISDIRLIYMPMDAERRDPDGVISRKNDDEDDDLDEAYFRVQRAGKWLNLRFSELTEDERCLVLSGWDNDALRRMCSLLANVIHTKCTRRYGDEVV